MGELPPVPEKLDLFDVLHSLSDPVRLSIVAQLNENDNLECGTFEVQVTKSTLTHHFRVLRQSGVIETTRLGTRSINHLRRSALETQFPGLLNSVLNSVDETGVQK
jgi:DNA-binding transcriptional ArsR family regulator